MAVNSKVSKTKDSDKDGTPDYLDSEPNNPLIPAKSDLGELSKYGKKVGITGPPPTPTPTPTPAPTGNTDNTGSKNTVNVTKKVFTMEQAQAYAEAAFKNAIGRVPNQQELLAFRTHLNNAEMANPSTTTYSKSGSTTTGGIDENQFAETQAKLNPEYAGYQKATTYFDAFMNTLNGPAGGSF